MIYSVYGLVASILIHVVPIIVAIFIATFEEQTMRLADQVVYKNHEVVLKNSDWPALNGQTQYVPRESSSVEPLGGVVDSAYEDALRESTSSGESVLIPFEVFVCDTKESSFRLAKAMTHAGTLEQRFSVAYDAFMDEHDCVFNYDVKVSRTPLYIERAAGSGVVAIAEARECSGCTEELNPSSLYAVLITHDIHENVFRCERDPDQYAANGIDTSLRCRRNT